MAVKVLVCGANASHHTIKEPSMTTPATPTFATTTTTTAPAAPDPRALYRAAQDWVTTLVAAVGPDQLDDATPCSEWDVRTLLGHLVATVDRARVIGEGREPFSVPSVVTGVPDDAWSARLARAVADFWPGWSDDARLDATLTAPWGLASGRGVLFGYAQEAVVHGWDLALATGQDAEAPGGLGAELLAAARDRVPAEPRGGPVPFGPVVTPGDDAGATEQLAAWLGHRPTGRD